MLSRVVLVRVWTYAQYHYMLTYVVNISQAPAWPSNYWTCFARRPSMNLTIAIRTLVLNENFGALVTRHTACFDLHQPASSRLLIAFACIDIAWTATFQLRSINPTRIWLARVGTQNCWSCDHVGVISKRRFKATAFSNQDVTHPWGLGAYQRW